MGEGSPQGRLILLYPRFIFLLLLGDEVACSKARVRFLGSGAEEMRLLCLRRSSVCFLGDSEVRNWRDAREERGDEGGDGMLNVGDRGRSKKSMP